MKKIGIVGAGWLGKDIALKFAQKAFVKYTNRTEKQIKNCQYFQFQLGKSLSIDFAKDLDFLFITITPPKSKEEIRHFIQEIKNKLSKNCIIIFTSSTSIYNSNKGIIDENSKELKNDTPLYFFEQELFFSFSSIILRLGGLIGEDRHPVKHLAGKKDILNGQQPINLVHKNDILQFMQLIIDNKIEKGIYNLVFPHHPSRQDYYLQKAKELKLEKPNFLAGEQPGKIICSKKSLFNTTFEYRWNI